MTNPAIALAMTGASGAAYGMRLLQILLATGNRVYLMMSEPGRLVINTELGFKLSSRPTEIKSILDEHFEADPDLLHVFAREDWFSPPASGSNPPRAMAVCPCTSGTLASIASGLSRNLIERAADVVLKERKTLVLVPRETPFSILHLENMLRLARMGAVILPANPGFYNQPTTVEELVDFIVARVLDHLDVEYDLLPRWGADRG